MDRSGLTADEVDDLFDTFMLFEGFRRAVVRDTEKLIEQEEVDAKETALLLFRCEFWTFVFNIITTKGKGEREKVFKTTVSRIRTRIFLGKELMEHLEDSWAELMFCFQSDVDKTLAAFTEALTLNPNPTQDKKDVRTYIQRLRVELDPTPQRRSRRIREMNINNLPTLNPINLTDLYFAAIESDSPELASKCRNLIKPTRGV